MSDAFYEMAEVERIDPSLLQNAYLGILKYGMMSLRNYSYSVVENKYYIEAEIDHLHNIPSYSTETNLHRHGYYFCTEKNAYLEKIADIDTKDLRFTLDRYLTFWNEIRDVLTPYKHLLSEHSQSKWKD